MTFFYDLNKKLAGLNGKQKLAEDGSWGMSEAMTDGQQFVDYVMSFYGPGGVYDMGVEAEDVVKATELYKKTTDIPFDGDSVDRENVRDILIDKFGYEWVNESSDEQPKTDLKRMKQLASIKEFAQDDSGDDVPSVIHTLANQWWNATDSQPQIASRLRSLGWMIKQTDSEEEDGVELTKRDGQKYYVSADTFDPDVFEDKADKDYDGDGKIESPKDEVWGSRAKAAAKAGTPFSEADVMGLEEGAPVDPDAVRELVLFADNDPDLYRQSYEPIIKNLQKKVNKGVYDVELAKKLWGYHADRAAQQYARTFGGGTTWHRMFSPNDRRAAAEEFEKNAREEIGAEDMVESQTDDAVHSFQDKQTAEKMKRLSNPRDYFESVLNQASTLEEESEEDVMDYLNKELADYDSTVNEAQMKIKPEDYKEMLDAISSIAKDKALAHKEKLQDDPRVKDLEKRFRWDLLYAAKLSPVMDRLYKYMNDNHIDTALKQIVKDAGYSTLEEDNSNIDSPANPIRLYNMTSLGESSVAKKTKKKLMDPAKAIKHVVDPEQKEEVEKYQVTGRLNPKKFKKAFLKDKFPNIDKVETDEDAVSRQYNGDGHNNAMPGIQFEDGASSSGGSISSKAGVTKHTAGGRYAAMGDEDDAPKPKKVKSGLGRGRPAKEKAPEYAKINDPFGRVGSAPKGKKGTVVKGRDTADTIDEGTAVDSHESPNYRQISKALTGLYAMLKDDPTITAEEVLGHIAEARAIWDGDDASFGESINEHGGGVAMPAGKSWQSMKPTKRSWQNMKEEAKPDFLDMDKDGNKSEPMKKAVADKAKGTKELDEKAVSKKQQKFMGMVHAAQKGEKPASKEVASVAKSMGKKDAKDFAATKHKGLPEKVKEGDNVMSIDNTAGAKESQTEPGSKKPGMEFGGSIYENFDAQVEKLISESISINVSQNVEDNGEPSKNVSVSASGDDAEKLAQILSLAGITGGVQPTVEPEAVEVVDAQPELSFDVRDFCPVCDCAPCECGSQEELDEEDVKVSDNEPDWPTNQETSDDALQYSGGLNKPKSTGQTTIPVIASQLKRQVSNEAIDIERSLFKTWKNYKG